MNDVFGIVAAYKFFGVNNPYTYTQSEKVTQVLHYLQKHIYKVTFVKSFYIKTVSPIKCYLQYALKRKMIRETLISIVTTQPTLIAKVIRENRRVIMQFKRQHFLQVKQKAMQAKDGVLCVIHSFFMLYTIIKYCKK